ncbi:MAG: hypothetical protein AB7V58_04825 [Solirubrobacterales bacterium]
MARGAFAGAVAAISLLALTGPLAPGAGAAAGCRPASNVEAMIDDSLSMEASDPNRLRVQGLDLLIETLPKSTTLGAIEFGSGLGGLRPPADRVFAPAAIGPDAAARTMERQLRARIRADNGLTDYNGAFALADAENPTAQARIFLTDGGHDEGEYANGHLAHRVPTYVVGFGAGSSGAAGQGRLRRIAAETGGRYRPLAGSGRLQAALAEVGAELACQAPPRSFSDQLARDGAAAHGVAIGAAARTARIVLTWASPLDRFRLSGLRLVPPGKARRPRRLRVERHGGTTFSVIEVSGLGRGDLRFWVRATKVGSGEPEATLTTQVSQMKKKGN